jgi:hypothetical protein
MSSLKLVFILQKELQKFANFQKVFLVIMNCQNVQMFVFVQLFWLQKLLWTDLGFWQ